MNTPKLTVLLNADTPPPSPLNTTNMLAELREGEGEGGEGDDTFTTQGK